MGHRHGRPLLQGEGIVESGQLMALSSNYGLYGDMSRRVMSVIRRHVPQIEQYSIDECFILLPESENYAAFGRHLSQIVERWTGIPVSIGIAPTKTLAKLASRFAKKHKGYQGCCLIDTPEKRKTRAGAHRPTRCVGYREKKWRQSSSRWASTPHGNSPDRDGNKSSCSWALRVKKLGAN